MFWGTPWNSSKISFRSSHRTRFQTILKPLVFAPRVLDDERESPRKIRSGTLESNRISKYGWDSTQVAGQLLESEHHFPLDDVRWSCYTYAFHQRDRDDGGPATQTSGGELWPRLSLANPAPFINDACGPDRSKWHARRKAQNVKYVEYVQGDPLRDWGVRIAAIRPIKKGETLLSDYGEE